MRLATFVLALTALSAVALVPVAFAQQNSNANNTSIYQNGTTLASPQGSVPVLEKLSDKGHYRVQLKWETAPLSPNGEFDMQVLFLNASSPHGNVTNIPQRESNYTGYSSRSNSVVPSIVDSPIAVDHYDLTIYDNNAHVLYQKTAVPGEASAGGVTVSLGNYTGPATISITNITAVAPLGSTNTAGTNGTNTDSVKFTTTVVPEFPTAPVVFLGALSVGFAIWRFKRRSDSFT